MTDAELKMEHVDKGIAVPKQNLSQWKIVCKKDYLKMMVSQLLKKRTNYKWNYMQKLLIWQIENPFTLYADVCVCVYNNEAWIELFNSTATADTETQKSWKYWRRPLICYSLI